MRITITPKDEADAPRAKLLEDHLNRLAEVIWTHYLLTGQMLDVTKVQENPEVFTRFTGPGLCEDLYREMGRKA